MSTRRARTACSTPRKAASRSSGSRGSVVCGLALLMELVAGSEDARRAPPRRPRRPRGVRRAPRRPSPSVSRARAPPARLPADQHIESRLHGQGARGAARGPLGGVGRLLRGYGFLLTVPRLVFITQQVDPAHPALAATVPKIARSRALVDEVVVLADGAVRACCPRTAACGRSGRARKLGRGARFEAALARELRGLRGGAVVAHMCPIYAVLAAPLVRPLRVRSLLWFTHWKATRLLRAAERVSTRSISVDRRSFPLPSEKVAGDRPRDRPLRVLVPRRRDRARLRLLALGRYSRAKGLDVVLRAVASVGTGSARRARAGALRRRDARIARSSAARRELALERRLRSRSRASPRDPGALRAHDALVNNMRAGAPDKVVYEAAAAVCPCSPRTPSSTACSSRSSASRARARTRWPCGFASSPPSTPRAGGARQAAAQPSGGALGRVLGARHPRAAVVDDGSGGVLHVQKVAGISGSEAHLLQLLPGLRERGWNVDFLMLHEDEPGAWDFARELRARRPARRRPAAGGRRSDRLRRVAAYLARRRPRILHTHLVHADVYGQIAGAMARVAAPALHEARLQLVPRGPLLRSRRPRRRLARARPHRDLAGARPLPRGDRGVRRARLRDRPLRDRRARRRGRRTRGPAAPALRRAADPGQGPPRSPAGARAGETRVPGLSSTSPARARSSPRFSPTRGSSGSPTRCASSASSRRCRQLSSAPRSWSCPPSARVSEWLRSRRWSADGRSSRARSAGFPRSSPTARPGSRPAGRRGAARRRDRRARRGPPRAAAMGDAGRRRALEAFTQERSTSGIEALYRRELESASS